MSCPATNAAVLLGMAKHSPCAGRMTAVFTPTTRPRLSTSGPPLFPGFSAASVWMMLSINRPVFDRNARAVALTTPAVTVYWNPYGLPIATTNCPTCKAEESPSDAYRRLRRVDVQDGQVRLRVFADEARLEPPPVGQGGLDRLRPVDDVAVGQDEPVGGKDEARPAPAAAPTPLRRIGASGVLHLDIHHRRAHRPGSADHRVGIRVERVRLVPHRRRRRGRLRDGRRA